MADTNTEVDAEFNAMQTVFTALNALEEEAQQRVLDYVSNRLGFAQQHPRPAPSAKSSGVNEDIEDEEVDEEVASTTAAGSTGTYSTFAELYDAARPKSQSDKALVGGYWLQQCQGAESFDSFSVNKELKNLGEGILNITSALDTLKSQKPALALQLKKAGKSRQARKTYKATVAGLKMVENMIRG